MLFVNLLCLVTIYNIDVSHASTHWMVTESGLIQPRLESPFEMARPYDLLSFLNQENHWDDIINLYNELSQKQAVISKLWTEFAQETDINTHIHMDKNCIDVGLLSTIDWYSSFLDDGSGKGIERSEYSLYDPASGQDTDIPDCKKISSLTYSMFTFDHLESVMNRANLTLNPEIALPTLISPMMNVDQFGHWVSTALKGNTSSWLHYNLASLYWRIRGNAPKAIECCRRALHYAPRRYKDIPLLSLGIILHRSKAVEDAITVLKAAVDHDHQYYLNHFILANAYAVYGDFNSSIEHIEKSSTLNPTMDLVLKHKSAIYCYAKITKKIDVIKVTLHQLRNDLKEYSEKGAHWLKAQGAFLKSMKHVGDFDYRNMEKNCQKMSELTGFDIKNLQDHSDKYALIKYFLDGPMHKKEWLEQKGVNAIESLYNLQNLIKHIEKHISMASDFIIHLDPTKSRFVIDTSAKDIIIAMDAEAPEVKSFMDGTSGKIETSHASEKKSESQYDDISEYESGFMMYPITMKVNRNNEEFDKDPEWPSDELCLNEAPDFPPNVEAIFPVFLPFENKGIRMKSLLTEKIGVPITVEHELPWHPPICPQDKDSASFIPKKTQKQPLVGEVVNTGYLREKLLEYVADGNMDLASNMQEAEIGQRIYAATQMNVAPKWMVLTLSSLYWRVRGNNINALHCLFAANRHVPSRYRDLVLVSLASIYLEMGYFDEALVAAEEAFRLSLYEPATNFILAELNLVKKHRSTHMFHLKQVVRVEGSFMNGLGRRLLLAWGCILKQAYKPLKEPEMREGDVCTQVEPGMNLVCEQSGDNCRMTNMQCYSQHQDKEAAGTMSRLIKDGKRLPSGVDKRHFQQVADGMPAREDAAAHRRHFAAMLRAARGLQGCGARGCQAMTAEDVSMRKEDCTYHDLQLGYWLQVVSFKQLITDSRLKFPPDVPLLAPSGKQYPECKLPVSPSEDFYVEKMMQVHSERWEPTISLMHQLAEMFEYFDYVTLGAKIAKYVDTVVLWEDFYVEKMMQVHSKRWEPMQQHAEMFEYFVNTLVAKISKCVDSKPSSWAGAFAAGWWCGAGGRGACAVRCLAAAHALAPRDAAALPLRALAALLHTQGKPHEAKEIAYLSFYTAPKNPFDAFIVGVSHTYLEEFDEAIWMYRYALEFDDKFLPAKACLHAAMCLMFYGDEIKGDGESLTL